MFTHGFSPVQPPPPNSIKPSQSGSSLYPNPYLKTSIPRLGILYSSISVPYERYPSHMCRRRSPPPPAKRAITAAAVQPFQHRRKTVQRGHHKTVIRVPSGTIKTVRRVSQDSPARPLPPQDSLARASQDSSSAIQRDCQDSPAGSVRQSGATAATGSGGLFGRAACHARRRQPSQHKPARHSRGCAPWPANTACHPSCSPATARKNHHQ
jgi:hypothetical protein